LARFKHYFECLIFDFDLNTKATVKSVDLLSFVFIEAGPKAGPHLCIGFTKFNYFLSASIAKSEELFLLVTSFLPLVFKYFLYWQQVSALELIF
jgi:hypothetical protein